ncbi:MAG: hypothetical protein ACRD9L_11585, partial [Bryobacteraceae bacterium]
PDRFRRSSDTRLAFLAVILVATLLSPAAPTWPSIRVPGNGSKPYQESFSTAFEKTLSVR